MKGVNVSLVLRSGRDEWGGAGSTRHAEAFRNLLPADRITPGVRPLEGSPPARGHQERCNDRACGASCSRTQRTDSGGGPAASKLGLLT